MLHGFEFTGWKGVSHTDWQAGKNYPPLHHIPVFVFPLSGKTTRQDSSIKDREKISVAMQLTAYNYKLTNGR